mgnify:FL=1
MSDYTFQELLETPSVAKMLIEQGKLTLSRDMVDEVIQSFVNGRYQQEGVLTAHLTQGNSLNDPQFKKLLDFTLSSIDEARKNKATHIIENILYGKTHPFQPLLQSAQFSAPSSNNIDAILEACNTHNSPIESKALIELLEKCFEKRYKFSDAQLQILVDLSEHDHLGGFASFTEKVAKSLAVESSTAMIEGAERETKLKVYFRTGGGDETCRNF